MFRLPSHLLAMPALAVFLAGASAAPQPAANEYAKHLSALRDLTVAVADAMPADKYDYKPHPDSMTFGELMTHIGQTDFQFCHGLHDDSAPLPADPHGKEAIVRYLSDSFSYCAAVVDGISESQLANTHDSPDGRMPGRDVLLAMYIHVAHHRGQAEIYLRNNNIVPPRYRI